MVTRGSDAHVYVRTRAGSYQRLFYDKGFIDIVDLKNIRNEMDLLVRSSCTVLTVQTAEQARRKLIAT